VCVSPPPTTSLLLLHIASSSHHHPCFLLFRCRIFLLTTLLHIMMSIIAFYIHYSYSTVAMTFIQRILKKIKKTKDLSGHSAYLSFFLLSLSLFCERAHILFVLLSCVVRIKNIVEDLVWMTLARSCVLSIFVYFEKRHRIYLLLLFFSAPYMYAYRYQLWMNKKK